MSDRLLFIVPALNESATVGSVVAELLERDSSAEVVVVDDGSTDRTAAIAAAAGATVLQLPMNLGIGAAVQTGLLYASRSGHDFAIQVDADGQHPATEIDALLEPLRSGACDAAVGSRFLNASARSSLPRRVGGSILSLASTLILRQRLTDATSGFRAYNRRAIGFLARTYAEDYPEPEALVALVRNGLRVQEVPVAMRARGAGKSSITALRAGYYMVKVLLALAVNATRAANASETEECDEPSHSGDRDRGKHRRRAGGVRADPAP